MILWRSWYTRTKLETSESPVSSAGGVLTALCLLHTLTGGGNIACRLDDLEKRVVLEELLQELDSMLEDKISKNKQRSVINTVM